MQRPWNAASAEGEFAAVSALVHLVTVLVVAVGSWLAELWRWQWDVGATVDGGQSVYYME
jgi:hypothetical protein